MEEAQELAEYLASFKEYATTNKYLDDKGQPNDILAMFIKFRLLAESVSRETRPLVFIPDSVTQDDADEVSSLWFFGPGSAVEFQSAVLHRSDDPPTVVQRLESKAVFSVYDLPPLSTRITSVMFDFAKAEWNSRLKVELGLAGVPPKVVILDAVGKNVQRLWEVVQALRG